MELALPRRRFLAAALALPAARLAATTRLNRLTRVRVAADRVSRVTTGLRPFRPSGFVVKAEKLDEKTVIHNYGHGGAGLTLSWGTSQLAVEKAAEVEPRDCAVVGCGVVGLSTARLLQLRGYNPVIYAKEFPPGTTSGVAGGVWAASSVFVGGQVTPEFRQQFGNALRIAFRRFESLVGDTYGIRWLPEYSLAQDKAAIQAPPTGCLPSDVDDFYPGSRRLAPHNHPFNVPYVSRRDSMLIEPPIYLDALFRDYLLNGGRAVIREFREPRDLLALPERLIFNCTGLGARELFHDAELTPIKGQLAILEPQPEVDYMTVGPGHIYMIPRQDGIVLGGSYDRGVGNTEADPAVTDRILRENCALFAAMRT
jgi:glycine/D-amino acid oxidase-like deaminating enzyme